MKESSDEFNPTVATPGVRIARSGSRRTARDYLALALATCGVGYIPGAPGTYGSAVGVGIYLVAGLGGERFLAYASSRGWRPEFSASARTSVMLLFVAALGIVGVWAASRTEKLLGRKDPGVVVIDEVVGQLITLLAVPYGARPWTVFAGFVAFRLFDIWKPYPVRRLESLESGLGIMADDVLAGAYGALLMSVVMSAQLLI